MARDGTQTKPGIDELLGTAMEHLASRMREVAEKQPEAEKVLLLAMVDTLVDTRAPLERCVDAFGADLEVEAMERIARLVKTQANLTDMFYGNMAPMEQFVFAVRVGRRLEQAAGSVHGSE